MTEVKSSYIQLGVMVTLFLKDYQDDIDEDLLDQMCSIALDYKTSQEGTVPTILPPVRVVEWKPEGVVVVPKTKKEVFLDKTYAPCEKLLARLVGLQENYLRQFSESITETLIEVYASGNTDSQKA